MSVFDRLAIGTANWGDKPYGHRGVTCPRSEQEKIITYCQSCGIHTIDTATAYGVDLSWLPTAFEINVKIRRGDEWPASGQFVWAHDAQTYTWFEQHGDILVGAAVYDYDKRLIEGDCHPVQLQVPYSAFDRRWERWIGYYPRGWQVRSVFCQGKVFTSEEPVFVRFRKYAGELGLPVGTLCLLFCLLNPYVDKVILGVDSEEQVREDLRFFHRLESFAVDDPNIIDPRRWDRRDPVDRIDGRDTIVNRKSQIGDSSGGLETKM